MKPKFDAADIALSYLHGRKDEREDVAPAPAIPETAREAARDWCYKLHAWRGRSPEFMQAQVWRLADIIQRHADLQVAAAYLAAQEHVEKAAERWSDAGNTTLANHYMDLAQGIGQRTPQDAVAALAEHDAQVARDALDTYVRQLNLDLAEDRRKARLACARWLLYVGGADDELIQDIITGNITAADGDKDVDSEIARLSQPATEKEKP